MNSTFEFLTMPTLSIDEVFDLIKSLSKSEKRFFKLTATTESNTVPIVKFFDEIESNAKKELLKSNKVIQKYLKVKNILEETYELILKSQRIFYAENIPGFQYKDEILNLKNLFDKAQYKQCRKMLTKLKEALYKEENFNLLLEIISIEKNLIDVENKFGLSLKSLDDLIEEEHIIIKKSKNLGEFTQAFSKLNFLVRQNMVVKTAKEFEVYDKFLQSRLFKNSNSCLSKKALVLFHHGRALCLSKKRDKTLSSEFLAMKKHMELNPFLIEEFPKRYLSAYNNLLTQEFDQKKYGSAEKLIEEFLELKNSPIFAPTDLQLKIFTSTSNAQLLIYTDGGKIDKAIPVVDHINKQIELFKDKINKEELLIFYYNITNLFIYVGQFSEANKYLELVLSANDMHLREDLQCFSRIQNIIVHYELKKIPQLNYILKTAIDFYKKEKSQFKTEQFIISMFQELIELKENKIQWQKYLKNYKELLSDPYEKIANYYFDFLSYLESKISQKPISKILYEKNASNWNK